MKRILLAFSLLLCLNALFSQSDEYHELVKRQLREKKEKLSKLEADNLRLRKENDNLRTKIDYLVSQVNLKENKLENVLQDFMATSMQLSAKEGEIARLKSSVDDMVATYSILRNQNSELYLAVTELTNKVITLNESMIELNRRNTKYEEDVEEDLDERGAGEIYRKAKEKTLQRYKPRTNDEKLNYISLGAGIGTNYSGLGINLQSRFGKQLGVGIHVSTGTNIDEIYAGAGLKLFYYMGGYIDVTYIRSIQTINECINCFPQKEIISLTTGWDIYFGRRFGIRLAIGGAYFTDSFSSEIGEMIDVGITYKF